MAHLRIVVFCGGSYVYGMEIRTLALMEGLQARGHSVFCIANAWTDGDFPRRLESAHIAYDKVYLGKLTKSLRLKHIGWTLNTAFHWPLALLRCRRILRQFDADVIVLVNRDAILLCRLILDPRKTLHRVGDLPDETAWGRRVYRFMDSQIRHYVAVSANIRDRLVALGISPGKATVVYNGVAPAKRGIRRSAAARRSPLTIGIVGQVGTFKGHDDLLEALRLLRLRDIEFGCAIFGTGDPGYINVFRTRARSYGLESRIRWYGYVADTDAIYDEIDICVAPSRVAEAAGNIVPEAGMRGIPVVVARSGGLPELVADGESGYVVEVGRPDQLADRLQLLLSDTMLWERMSDFAYTFARSRFGIEQMVEGFEAVCRRVADR